MTRTLLSLIAVGFFACGGSGTNGDTTPKNPCADNPCAGNKNPCAGNKNPCAGNPCNPCAGGRGGAKGPQLDFSQWKSLTKISKTPFGSKGHKGATVDVYISEAAANQYRSAKGTYAEGTQVVKTHLKGGKIEKLLVMQKMKAGYDGENGNWFYGVYSADGKKQMMGGKIKACIGCHDAQGSDVDYLIGVPKAHQ